MKGPRPWVSKREACWAKLALGAGPGLSRKRLAECMSRGYWAVKLEKRHHWVIPRWSSLDRFGVEVKSA